MSNLDKEAPIARQTVVLRCLADNEYASYKKRFLLADCAVEICEEWSSPKDDAANPLEGVEYSECNYSLYSNSLWDGSLMMAALLRDQPFRVLGRRVLEIGAGLGLPAIVAAALGGRAVATEQLPLDLLNREARRNEHVIHAAGGSIEVKELDWEKPSEEITARLGTFDLVIGCDILAGVKAGTRHFKQILDVVSASTSVWGECLLTWVPRCEVSVELLLEAVRAALPGWQASFLQRSLLDPAFVADGARILYLGRPCISGQLDELD